jgi:hypothetical protein
LAAFPQRNTSRRGRKHDLTTQHRRRAELALVERCCAGEEAAWARLAQRFLPPVRRNVARVWRSRKRGNDALIQDAVQDLFVDLLTRAELLRGFGSKPERLERFLTRLAWRRAEALWHREQRRKRCEARIPAEEPEPARNNEVPVEDLAERLMAHLSPVARLRLRSLLDRTFSDDPTQPTPEALRTFTHACRRLLAELEPAEKNLAGQKTGRGQE